VKGKNPTMPPKSVKPTKQQIIKASIPRALREQVWVTYAGRVYERKCLVPWCQNTMSVFDFHVGHDVPESAGGKTDIPNLRPICARCNLSMGNEYTVAEWSVLSPAVTTETKKEKEKEKSPWWICCHEISACM
jgi:5-methylcytosine-specific restriction endonuclease McrA